MKICSSAQIPFVAFHEMKNLSNPEYDILTIRGPKQCARQCYNDKQCKSVNYNKETLTCHLNDFDLDPSHLEKDDHYIFIQNITGTKELMGPCWNHSCKENEKCLVIRTSYRCLKKGCRHPLYVLDEDGMFCYRLVTNPKLNWTDANGFCAEDGGRLISLPTRLKIDRLGLRFLGQVLRFWIGLNDIEEEGRYKWTTGHAADIQIYDWYRGKPNNRGQNCPDNADCIYMKNNLTVWDIRDACCAEELKFICEIGLGS
ncbi:C-type lectin lectoxin-Thr1-like [Saccostrea cucullata]|uniref:C-type lectin lectoxin-Thr1-like n=1 Tax=Saccostrea cuccullata TaxID=36930 RepID=UPI002ED4871A